MPGSRARDFGFKHHLVPGQLILPRFKLSDTWGKIIEIELASLRGYGGSSSFLET